MITVSNADAALKSYYLDAFSAQLNGDISPFFNAIEKTNENVFGKDVKLSIAKNSMNGVVAISEDDDLPLPIANRYYGITLPLKNIYGSIEISDKALRASADSSGAFVNLLNAEMDGLVASAKANFARMLYGDGNGLLCKIKSKNSDGTLTVNSAKSYYVGLNVTIYSSPVVKTVISAVDPVNNKITVRAGLSSTTINGGERICLMDTEDNELYGLATIFEGNYLYGFARSSERYFQPLTRHTSLSALTADDLVSLVDDLEADSDSKVNMILCSHRARKKIATLMNDSRRIVNSTELATGYTSIFVNDVPVYADKFCPEDRIYFVNTNDFVLAQLCDWSWMEDEDGKVLKQIPGRASYTATLVKYAELVCKKPCGQGAIILDTP